MGATDPGKAIRLLAVDIDGTLVSEGDLVTPPTRAAMQVAHGRMALVLATGRRYRTARAVLSSLGLALPVVCLGGSLTKGADGRTLDAVAFDPAHIDDLLVLAREHGLALILQRDAHALGGPDFVVDASVPWNGPTESYVRFGGPVGSSDPSIVRSRHEDVLVVGCFGGREELGALEADIAALGRHETVLVPSKKTPGWYLEVIVGGVSKWTALKRYAARIGVAENTICAVGDALNDLPMIRGAGFGVALGNADPTVKAAAAWTTGRNDEDGVASLIEHLFDF